MSLTVMKRLLLVLSLLLSTLTVPAQQDANNQAHDELQELVDKLQTKLNNRQTTLQELSPELKGFDALSAKYRESDPEVAAGAKYLKALTYLQVFGDTDTAVRIFKQVEKDFPKTRAANSVPQIMESLARMEARTKLFQSLKPGVPFPPFEEKDLNGETLSLSSYKGKVVLVDFWATWCKFCVQELPNTKEVYDKYHKKGFEIIGVSADEDKELLAKFIKLNKMPWKQICDGQAMDGKLMQNTGIMGLPSTFLLDKEGKIIGKDLQGDKLASAVAEALKKK